MKRTKDDPGIAYRDGLVDECCAACRLWLGNAGQDRCMEVSGRIEGSGYCNLFERK